MAPVNDPRRWPNSSDSTSAGESAEMLIGKKFGRCVAGRSANSAARRRTEIARARNGPRHQFLAGARRTGDERGKIAHPREERPAIAPHIVREDGLPDRCAQSRRRHRTADDVVENRLKRALDLVEAGEDVRGAQAGLESLAGQQKQAIPVGEKLPVELPASVRLPETLVIALVNSSWTESS